MTKGINKHSVNRQMTHIKIGESGVLNTKMLSSLSHLIHITEVQIIKNSHVQSNDNVRKDDSEGYCMPMSISAEDV